ncbi:(d)CMP kinase [Mesoterricola sediminis]|uniref:Cytidylate kinase n=1 Tax=Mesoterricola sediminis TaxID=2927980 RepID=A0AA48GXD8_9BACT|nr:(d)CMP kinase [Mesoterricola sediminis]BDU76140.1 cytidylate kinase [Mesoterricola sediminis]
MQKLPVIALDGPSGVGKSTTAKAVAKALGWQYLDTGAMYRATALALRRAGASLEDREAVERVLGALRISQRGTREFLGDEDVSDAIRTPDVSRMVTPVSADARVREVLVEQQRALAREGGWVVDGRDIGTVVFPDACCKVFLTASVEVRARRRTLELEAKGTPQPFAEVASDIERRDHADSTRAVAPLRRAEDAVELDSGDLDLDQVVAWIVDLHRGRGHGGNPVH